MAAAKNDNELRLVRVYDAPVKLVWDAWVDPKKAVKWWGPRGFTFTHHSKELRPGGTWRYTMHGPDGTDFPNIATYHEVVEHKKLVYDHGATDTTPPLFRVTVTFEEKNGKTTMDMTMRFESPEKAREISKFIKLAGGNATWDRLGEYLDHVQGNQETFIINRSFNTDIHTMFKMWTDPAHFEKWLPPTGLTMKFLKSEIKVGSQTFYSMGNDQFTMYGGTKYLEIEPPRRLVYLQHFSDEHGNLSRHPGAPEWPAYMLSEVTFTEEGPHETRVTIRWQPYGEITPGELQAFIKEKPGMTQGWTGSLDKLEALVSG